MTTKAELLEQAKDLDLDVKSSTKKADIQAQLDNAQDTPSETDKGYKEAQGYSYGVAPNDTDGTADTEPRTAGRVQVQPTSPANYLNDNSDNPKEVSKEDQAQLEEELSIPEEGISARVIVSTGNYVKVKFLQNNKPFAIYKSRAFDVDQAKSFIEAQLKEDA